MQVQGQPGANKMQVAKPTNCAVRGRTQSPVEDEALEADIGEILAEAFAIEKAQLAQPEEPLVAACRNFLAGTATADEPLRLLLQDRTVRGIVHRQGLRYRLSEPDREDLLQDLGELFQTKLLPKLRDPEKVWSVLAISARRLARGHADRLREVLLDDMPAEFDAKSNPQGREGVVSRLTDALHEAAGLIATPHEDGDRHIDRQRAIDKFNGLKRLMQALDATPLKASYAEDGLPPGQFRTEEDLRPAPVSLRAAGALTMRLPFKGIFPANGAAPAPDAVTHRIERMPLTYGLKLAKIRMDLGLTVKDFAAALNVSEPLMAQYVTCAAAVPKFVWEDAQVLGKQGAPEHKALVQRFGRKPMQSIAAAWIATLSTRLGREAKPADLARATGVHKSTVFRWFSEGHKPDLRDLADFEEMVLGNKPARERRTRTARKP